ncbi:MAG TPA: hypothetical protein VH879_06145 [Gemmatimonadales bacterium]
MTPSRRSTLLFLIPVLAACAGKPEPARRSSADSAGNPAAYPTLPQVTSPPVVSQAPPAPDDSSVTWPELESLIRTHPDSLRAVMQTRARKVTVVFKSGHRYHATEPAINTVVKLLRTVDPSGQILIATE